MHQGVSNNPPLHQDHRPFGRRFFIRGRVTYGQPLIDARRAPLFFRDLLLLVHR